MLGGLGPRFRAVMSPSLGFGFGGGVCAELGQQPAAAVRQQGQPLRVDAVAPRVFDQQIVDAFETDRLVGHDFGDAIGALKDVRVGDQQQDACWRAFHQAAGGLEDRGAGSFGTDQRAGDVEAIFRQK